MKLLLNNKVVIGATNRPNAIDIALRRTGRFDREVDVHPPDPSERSEIIRLLASSLPLAADVSFDVRGYFRY